MTERSEDSAAPRLPVGTAVLVPIHGIAVKFEAIDRSAETPPPLYDLPMIDGRPFLRMWVRQDDPPQPEQRPWLMRAAKTFATALAIATFGHVWVEPVLLDDKLEVLWHEPKVLSLIVEKEIDPGGPALLENIFYIQSMQLGGWISAQYPQVFVFHQTGLFLLRWSLGYDYADYFHGEAVVAFYKCVEAIVARRRRLKPELKQIQQEAAKLKANTDANEIKELYIARSAAGAHGGELHHVSRATAVDAKLFAEEMVWKDYFNRRAGGIAAGGPRKRPGSPHAQTRRPPNGKER